MNFVVADYARIAPFSPVKYMWFDMSDTNALKKKYDHFATGAALIDVVPPDAIEDIPMPFDDIVLILSVTDTKTNRDVRIVVSVERGAHGLRFNEWSVKHKIPVASLTFRESLHKDPETGFNPDYMDEMTKRGVPTSAVFSQLRKLMGFALPIFACLCYSKPLDGQEVIGYRCTDDNPSNAKRIRKGKRPLFEWTTVNIRAAEPSESLGGTHASPKPHDRRGHQRRYKSGKVVYIRPMTINKHKIPSEGFIHHDYKVVA